MRRIGMTVLGLTLVTTPLASQRSALREVHDGGSFGANFVVAQPLGAFRRTGSVAPGLSGFAVAAAQTEAAISLSEIRSFTCIASTLPCSLISL